MWVCLKIYTFNGGFVSFFPSFSDLNPEGIWHTQCHRPEWPWNGDISSLEFQISIGFSTLYIYIQCIYINIYIYSIHIYTVYIYGYGYVLRIHTEILCMTIYIHIYIVCRLYIYLCLDNFRYVFVPKWKMDRQFMNTGTTWEHMEGSWNGRTPESSILFSDFPSLTIHVNNVGGTPIYGKPHMMNHWNDVFPFLSKKPAAKYTWLDSHRLRLSPFGARSGFTYPPLI